MKSLVKALFGVMTVIVIAGAVGVMYKYTNGFNEDFKTFYVEYNGEKILTTDVKQDFEPNAEHKFDVKYLFDENRVKYSFDKDGFKLVQEKAETPPRDYNVKIIYNTAYDFDFTAEDKRYKYSKAKEPTNVFSIDKREKYFTVSFTRDQTLAKVLGQAYGTNRIVLPNNLDEKLPYPYILVVSSYNDSVKYNIRFCINGVSNNGKPVTGEFEIEDITLDRDDIVFGGNP